MFAVVVLGYLEEIAAEILEDEGLRQEARALKEEVYQAIEAIGKTKTEEFGEIYAYETDGYGMYNLMDDANMQAFCHVLPGVSGGSRDSRSHKKIFAQRSESLLF